MADSTLNSPQALVADVSAKFDRWRQIRRPHDIQTFVNAGMIRGQQETFWNPIHARLDPLPYVPHKERRVVNKILPKVQARRAKALKNRAIPQVQPASTDRDDVLNAKATEKALDYLWRKQELEQKFQDALLYSEVGHKGFWWFWWDETVNGRITQEDPFTGESFVIDAPIGDVCVEAGSHFEILVSDPGISNIYLQPEIMRVKFRDIEELKARYPQQAESIHADEQHQEIFHYNEKIARLNNLAASPGITSLAERGGGSTQGRIEGSTEVVVKELFTRPCAKYPRGRYVVVAGEVLLKSVEELPYGLWDSQFPYPVVEFVDLPAVGQYWGSTVVEQAVDLQREYNKLISYIDEQVKLASRPKVIFYKQHGIPDGAWTAEAGEVLVLNYVPGLPPPHIVNPGNVAADVWRRLQMIKEEFEDIFQIYPASEGAVGSAKSGFQTNLLQEANDNVHAPYIRGLERSVERAGWLIRRLMKLGYTVPRLITVLGRNSEPEVLEFSSEAIDEHADIIVKAGSALPQSRAARVQSVLELHNQGLFGDPADPDVRRRVLGLLELGNFEVGMEFQRRDEDQARLENAERSRGIPMPDPDFFENHAVHYAIHADDLKSAASRNWDPEERMDRIQHLVRTSWFIDPNQAQVIAQMYGLEVPPPPGQAPPPPEMMPASAGPPPGPPPVPPQGVPPPAPPQVGPPPAF